MLQNMRSVLEQGCRCVLCDHSGEAGSRIIIELERGLMQILLPLKDCGYCERLSSSVE